MRKTIGVIATLMLFCIALVSATEVDCKSGHQNRWDCQEWEVQEAVDKLDNDIEDLQDDMEDMEDDIDTQGNRIHQIRNQVNNVKNYIGNNEEDWLKDDATITNNNGGGSLSPERLSKWLIGFGNLFDVYDNLLEYLNSVFATKIELEDTNLRMDKLEARINLGSDATENEIAIETLVIGAERRGEPLKINGLTCENGICIGVN